MLNNFYRKIVFEACGRRANPSVRFRSEGLRRRRNDRPFNHDVRLPRRSPSPSPSLSLFLSTAVYSLAANNRGDEPRAHARSRLSLEIAATPTPLSRVHGSGTINNARGGHYLSLTPVFTTKGERVCGNRRPTRLPFATTRSVFRET